MDLIKHLEELSMLKFSDEEREEFKQGFDKILGFVSEIEQIDIDGENFDNFGINLSEFREDQEKKSMERDDSLKNAPSAKDGCFVCPLVID